MGTESEILAKENWVVRLGGRVLIHVGPHPKADLNHDCVRHLLHLRKAHAAFWSYDWDCGREGPWYAFVCDTRNYDLDKIRSSDTRYKIRRCLRTCRISHVEPDWLAEHGYETYIQAVARYRNYRVEREAEYRRELLDLAGRPDLRIHGVFTEDRLIAYGLSFMRGRGVRLGSTKFDPAFSAARPMFGLYYTLTHEYLTSGEFDFVDNGTRPLLHDTRIGEFLVHMGWRKAYCRLGMELSRPARSALRVARWLRRPSHWLLPDRYASMIEAALNAEDLARAPANQTSTAAAAPNTGSDPIDHRARCEL